MLSGAKWLRMAIILTWTRLPLRLMPRLALGASDVRVGVVRELVELDLLVLDHRRRNRLGVVRLADGREVEQQLHLVAADVDTAAPTAPARGRWAGSGPW